jgi:hypothetical protein
MTDIHVDNSLIRKDYGTFTVGSPSYALGLGWGTFVGATPNVQDPTRTEPQLSMNMANANFWTTKQTFAGANTSVVGTTYNQANVRLCPQNFVGPPATLTWEKGDLIMDSNADLWICVTAGAAAPGNFKKVTAT